MKKIKKEKEELKKIRAENRFFLMGLLLNPVEQSGCC
jgi:hypothetical protein